MSCINLTPLWFIIAKPAWLSAALPMLPDGLDWLGSVNQACRQISSPGGIFLLISPQSLLCTKLPQTFLFIPRPSKQLLGSLFSLHTLWQLQWWQREGSGGAGIWGGKKKWKQKEKAFWSSSKWARDMLSTTWLASSRQRGWRGACNMSWVLCTATDQETQLLWTCFKKAHAKQIGESL